MISMVCFNKHNAKYMYTLVQYVTTLMTIHLLYMYDMLVDLTHSIMCSAECTLIVMSTMYCPSLVVLT